MSIFVSASMAPAAVSSRHGGWRQGDPVGQRLFSRPFGDQPLRLESGQSLGPITLAWERWGEFDAERSNAILLLHGFSGDSHAAGPAGVGHDGAGWWDRLIGPGRAIDTERFCVICPNVLGGCQGSTGPASPAVDGRPYGSRFPLLSIRDMVAAERGLADRLGIARWYAVIGGSMGGMRALEWAVGSPQRLERLLLIATAARCSADNLAAHVCQIEAIRQDPQFCGGDYDDQSGGGPRQGLALARSLAQLTYLSAAELERQLAADRIGVSQHQSDGPSGSNSNDNQSETERDDPCDVDQRHGDREAAMAALLERDSWALVQRFDANSYITLTRAMNRHDIGRGRGGLRAALARVTAQAQVVAVSSDRLFPPCCQQELAAGLPAGATYTTLHSDLGHDGFLAELEQLRLILGRILG